MQMGTIAELATEVQNVSGYGNVPKTELIRAWAATAYGKVANTDAEVTVRVVDEEDGRQLNMQYRNQPAATNVLSFPFEDPPGMKTKILGDIVLCAPVISREALDQGKPLAAHWAHMIVHGVLHLCGYRHDVENDADLMEQLEAQIIEQIGFTNPYTEIDGQ